MKTYTKEFTLDKYLDIELQDDDSEWGGVSFIGETVRDFLESIDAKPKSLVELNKLLRDAGILEV